MNVRLVMLLLLTTVAARERGTVTGDRRGLSPTNVVSIIPLATSCIPSEVVAVDVAQVRFQHVSVVGDFKQPDVFGPETQAVGVRVAIALAGSLARAASTTSHGERCGS